MLTLAADVSELCLVWRPLIMTVGLFCACGGEVSIAPPLPTLPIEGAPRGYEGGSLAFDVARNELIQTGGEHSDPEGITFYAATWAFDGLDWTIKDDTQIPRYGHATAYDAKRERLVMFGGFGVCGDNDSNDCCNDTLEWDGSSWTQIETDGPTPRLYHAMVYDSVGERVLLFGGIGCGRDEDPRMWAFDGQSWEVLP